jgi:AcrR family transcriptional regulator
MVLTDTKSPAVRTFTAKGIATRERIVDAASILILEHGVEAAKLEDIQAAAHVSASQLYHYFEDKSALILAVIDHQTEAVLGAALCWRMPARIVGRQPGRIRSTGEGRAGQFVRRVGATASCRNRDDARFR